MLKPVRLLLLLMMLISISWFSASGLLNGKKIDSPDPNRESHRPSSFSMQKLEENAEEAREYTKTKQFNESVCFLIDMSLPSGQNRFFVYDLKRDSILNSGLVAHGRCNKNWLDGRQYGNTVGCGCTSLGKYKVGQSYQGRFGEAFKLHGLEKTNDKAFERFVVLHSYECVPNNETSEEICQSDGCPMLAPAFLDQLKPIIKKSTKPMMLWIYE